MFYSFIKNIFPLVASKGDRALLESFDQDLVRQIASPSIEQSLKSACGNLQSEEKFSVFFDPDQRSKLMKRFSDESGIGLIWVRLAGLLIESVLKVGGQTIQSAANERIGRAMMER